jgi:site-specific DNA-methyltransferase (adenine-specific)
MKHEFENSRVYLMDCIEGMKQYPDKYFDLAIVDPPYGISIHKMNFTQSVKGGVAKRKDYSDITDWDSNTPNAEYFAELQRVSKNQIIWGWNYFVENLTSCKCYIVWDKKTEDKYSNDFADCETAWTSFNKPAKVYRHLWSGMLQQNMKDKEVRIHPTQKPVALYDWLLMNYAEKGDLILDTHLGSGSSRIAAYKNGFNFVGFEIDSDYFNAQEKRFNEFKSQLCLFN